MHWTKKHAENKKIERLVRIKCRDIRNSLMPCLVTFIRCAPRRLDDDNNIYAFKHIRDTVADLIKPGLKPGHADSDERMVFAYDQHKTSKNVYEVIIKVESL